MSRPTNLGQTKTRANALVSRGYKFHLFTPLNQSRPALAETDYLASPIREEGVVLYSFAKESDRESFVEKFGGEVL